MHEIVSTMCDEVQALNLITALAQRFDLVGCGYWGLDDIERELEREISVDEYKYIRRQYSENAEPTCFADEMRWHL